MNALWQLFGELLTTVVLIVLFALAITEYIGARVPGFMTISDAARAYVTRGDYRLFLAVLAMFLLASGWWCIHVLWRI
jgi:hypothetical protein